MSRPKPSFFPEPRILTSPTQVAAVFGRGEEWFRRNRDRLEAAGFPRRDPLIGGWDFKAINGWLNDRSNIGQGPATNPWDEVLENGQSQFTLC